MWEEKDFLSTLRALCKTIAYDTKPKATPQTIKSWLKSGFVQVREQFKQSPAAVDRWLILNSILLDLSLRKLWRQHLGDRTNEAALLATGGYARREQYPYSDVDILVLLPPSPSSELLDCVGSFVTSLWDLNLKIGHSVRTIQDCDVHSQHDLTIATTLLDHRLLIGQHDLHVALKQLTDDKRRWPSSRFYHAKVDEQQARHRKENNSALNLEPNIKLSPGGLRDLHTMMWITLKHFGTNQLTQLVSASILTEEELSALLTAQNTLRRIRFALHTLTERAEDRLLFNLQLQIAAFFGFKDLDHRLAVEQFMQTYYRAAHTVQHFNTLFIQLFDEHYIQRRKAMMVQPINELFQIRNHVLELTHADVYKTHPLALLETFKHYGTNPQINALSADTLRQLYKHRRLVDEAYRAQPASKALFMDILKAPHKVSSSLALMNRTGILHRYLPAFAHTIGQMQFDLIHIYTVDAHILRVIRNLREFTYDTAKEKFQLAHHIWHHLPKRELLIIAAMFHDIGKGRGGDHSQIGAHEATLFCEQHGLSAWESELICWLVEHHLLMSMTAQKKDITDPQVLNEFASLVGDVNRLDHLYTLTVADICGTNPQLWSSWRDALLRQLYLETRRCLRRGLDNPLKADDIIAENQSNALSLLRNDEWSEAVIRERWKTFGSDYFLKENFANIAWHTRLILRHKQNKKTPLVRITSGDTSAQQDTTQLFIYAHDQPNLFAAMVTIMDNIGLNIQKARIMTSDDGFSLDTYYVSDTNPTPLHTDARRCEQIESALVSQLTDASTFPELIRRRIPRQLKSFTFPTEVVITNEAHLKKTTMEIISPDRPGLLAEVGRVLARNDIVVHDARINTIGERVEDVFSITDQSGNPISDPIRIQQLRAAIASALDN